MGKLYFGEHVFLLDIFSLQKNQKLTEKHKIVKTKAKKIE
uniref:Uncharacterized protein n=1 Tax=Romanomermis culicivorax TaxID=13658 RepID=A0A915K4M9_ROMCU